MSSTRQSRRMAQLCRCTAFSHDMSAPTAAMRGWLCGQVRVRVRVSVKVRVRVSSRTASV